MLQPRISTSLRPKSTLTLSSLAASLTALAITSTSHPSQTPFSHTQVRTAYHASQGQANGPKDSAGKRLGLKASATQYVVPGTIIFRQRGTKWHPGENVGMGRDHTIYATVHGYVRYYRDPERHKKRKYIGVSLEREGKMSVLPTPKNAISRRSLGMYAVPIKTEKQGRGGEEEARAFLDHHISEGSKGGVVLKDAPEPPVMREGQYRIANIELARQAERRKVKVRPFDRKDRFFAWRVRTKKIKEKKLARASMAKGKKKQQQKKRTKKA